MNSDKTPFATGDLVVYPTHGVGKIVAIETQEISGHTLNVFVVHFDKDRMTLRVPLGPSAFAEMMGKAGFSRVNWQAMSGGIVTLYSGWHL